MFIIRADGGNGLGMGHLARTSILAKEINKFNKVCYVCSSKYPEGIEFVRKKGFEAVLADNVLEMLMCMEADGILTDCYAINEEYIEKVRAHFKLVGYIDDNVLFNYKADFVLNQNFGAEALKYKVDKGCKLFLGTQYLLMREEFKKIKPIKIKEKAEKIFITVGATDSYNFTGKLLEMIGDLSYEWHVVIGPVFPHKDKLIAQYKKQSNIIFEICPQMSEIAGKCDMAICSCGSTLYEMGLMGIPTIGIVVADNQKKLADRMNQARLIINLGKIQELEKEKLIECVNNLALDKDLRNSLQLNNNGELNVFGEKEIIEYIHHVTTGRYI